MPHDESKTEEQIDYLIGMPFDEVHMVYATAVRQTINGAFVSSTAEIVNDNDYEVAYVKPVDDGGRLKAVVALPEAHKMSVIPYPMKFDWLCKVIRYDCLAWSDEHNKWMPYIGDDPVFD